MDNEKNKNFAFSDLLNFNATFTAQAPSKYNVQYIYTSYYFISNYLKRQSII